MPPPSDTRFLSMYPSATTTKNYSILSEFLKKISYKPGWKISLRDDPSFHGFVVVVNYEGYESENAAFVPLCIEEPQVSEARQRISVSIGRTVRKKETRYFQRRSEE